VEPGAPGTFSTIGGFACEAGAGDGTAGAFPPWDCIRSVCATAPALTDSAAAINPEPIALPAAFMAISSRSSRYVGLTIRPGSDATTGRVDQGLAVAPSIPSGPEVL